MMNDNMNELFKKAQQLQQQLQQQQAKLAEQEVEGSAGGDMVRVVMRGNFQVTRVHIAPELLRKEDQNMLEDLVASAVNNACTQLREASQKGLGSMASELGLPPGFMG